MPYRTLQRWLAAWRHGGLDALAKADRRDKGLRRFPMELVAFIEGLALRKPVPSAATIHRQAEYASVDWLNSVIRRGIDISAGLRRAGE